MPAETAPPERHLGELRGIFKALPRLDRGDTSFADDVLAGVTSQPSLPEETEWE